jgi:hypothetical protein
MKPVIRSLMTLGMLMTALTACNIPTVDSQADGNGPSSSSGAVVTSQPPAPPANAAELVQPEDIEYLGAFRLPDGGERPLTFEYGGNAMTFNPDGDPDGAADGFPGSLFITGHDRMPYGDLPDGSQVAEVDIPAPVLSRSVEELNMGSYLQGFHNVAANAFTTMDEIPRIGMLYLNRPETGPLIHIGWGAHLHPPDDASHAWFSPDLAHPDMQGFWFIGNQDLYSVNGYMFEIPQEWADTYIYGRDIGTGRMRDGGMGGMGPTLFAYSPWLPDGSAPANGTHLEESTLLLYESSYNSEEIVRSMNGYQYPDEWEGGAWLTSASGKSAVLFAGTKSNGTKFWYGYINPDGAQYACVDAHVLDFPTCRTADGGICPNSDLSGCCNEESGGCVSLRGWWSTHFDAEIILYNPDDLARVAAGEMEPWEPQPYAVIDIDEHLFLNPPEWDLQNVGWGDQRRFRIGDVAFDRENGILYVLELSADGAKPVVHVWRVK